MIVLPGPRGRGRGFGGLGWWLGNFSLLLIAEKPRHGYEIANELKKLGFPIFGVAQMGMIYRILLDLEAGGFIVPTWDTRTSPPRKIYRITPAGLEYLDQVTFEMESLKELIDSFLERYSEMRRRENGRDEGSGEVPEG